MGGPNSPMVIIVVRYM